MKKPSSLTSFRQQIEKSFYEKFPTKEQVIATGDSGWYFTPYFEEQLSSALSQQLSLVEEEVKSMKLDPVARFKQLCGPGGCNKANRRKNMKELKGYNQALDSLLTRIKSGNENKQIT